MLVLGNFNLKVFVFLWYIKIIAVIRKEFIQVLNNVAAVIPKSAKIEKRPLCIKTNLHIKFDNFEILYSMTLFIMFLRVIAQSCSKISPRTTKYYLFIQPDLERHIIFPQGLV